MLALVLALVLSGAEPVHAGAGGTGRSASAALPAAAPASPDSATRWALVLSGGLARGLAHVGVLRALEEQGLCPDVLVSTSMGSVVGALWAAGRTSHEIHELFRRIDAQVLLDPQPRGSWWRGSVVPRPWFSLFGPGGLVRLPTGMLDDASLNDLLARHLLDADALAQGDFDRLRVPWRSVATDLATLGPVVLDSGSVALAVRSSLSMPVIFPGVYDDARLLADGGVVSHLPIAAAQAQGVDHVLAIDVALPLGPFDENTSAVQVALGLLQQMSRRGRADARPGRDAVMWLPMPGVSPVDFRLVDTLVAIGHRATRDTVARLARDWGLPRRGRPAGGVELPPLASLRWSTREGRPVRMAAPAARLLGALPLGAFAPDTLQAGLGRVYRADLFDGVWPRFRIEGGRTDVVFQVREHRPFEVTGAAGFEHDEGGRLIGAASVRPLVEPFPAVITAGGTWRRFGHSWFGSFEPRSLARGATGLFVRGGARRTETRIFDRDRRWTERVTRRGELLAGGQLRLWAGDVLQIGAGAGRVWTAGADREGAMGALRLDARGRVSRTVEAVAFGGARRYVSARGTLSIDYPLTFVTIRPALLAGWASSGAPLDEHHGVGGPTTLTGMRRHEWFGRRALGAELRLVRHLATALDLQGYLQAAHVARPVSRTDLADRPHVAAGIGLETNILFGPLSIDFGWGEGGAHRIDISFGPEF